MQPPQGCLAMTPPQGCPARAGRPPPAHPNTRVPPTLPVLLHLPATRSSTYAQVVMLERPPNADTPSARVFATQGLHRIVGGPNTGRHPVDPRQEGRCLRYLAQDHTIKACQEPMKCRLYLQGGHRHVSCPLKMPAWPSLAATGLYACLVGEIWDADLV